MDVEGKRGVTVNNLRKATGLAVAVFAILTITLAGVPGVALAAGGHGGGFHGGGFHGGGKFFHGGHRWGGHRWHGHRFYRFGGYGYAYNTCWKYTPYGLVNVCKVPY